MDIENLSVVQFVYQYKISHDLNLQLLIPEQILCQVLLETNDSMLNQYSMVNDYLVTITNGNYQGRVINLLLSFITLPKNSNGQDYNSIRQLVLERTSQLIQMKSNFGILDDQENFKLRVPRKLLDLIMWKKNKNNIINY